MKALLENAAYGQVSEVSRPPDLAGSRSVPAADAAALSLVFLLFFCVVCFALGAAVLGRREKRMTDGSADFPTPANDRDLRTGEGQRDVRSGPWEREPDWWKKST
jgi:hypothetical protein